MTIQTKLHVNLTQGVIDIEGDQTFVQKVYEDFKERLLSAKITAASQSGDSTGATGEENSEALQTANGEGRKKARKTRKARSAEDGSATEKVGSYVPTLDKDLNTSKLPAFYNQWAPKNHPEKILLFAKFLEEELKISSCTANQIFTCYREVRERIPEVFIQAIRDASGSRYGYVDYKSVNEIKVTIRGSNHYEHGGIKKKATE